MTSRERDLSARILRGARAKGGTPTATMPDPASRQTLRHRFDRTSPRRSDTNTSTTAKTTAAGSHSQETVITSSFTRPATRMSVLDSYQDQDWQTSHKGLPRRHPGSRRGLCVRDAPMGASDGDSNRVGLCICLRGGRSSGSHPIDRGRSLFGIIGALSILTIGFGFFLAAAAAVIAVTRLSFQSS